MDDPDGCSDISTECGERLFCGDVRPAGDGGECGPGSPLRRWDRDSGVSNRPGVGRIRIFPYPGSLRCFNRYLLDREAA